MKKWFKVIILAIILFLFVLQFIPNRIYIKGSDVGVGSLQKNNEEVKCICFGSIYNLSFRPCTVILEITSERDVNDGFLANENLKVESVEVMEGGAKILNNHIIYVPPISES